MLTRIKIDGFKSLVNFEMEFAPFTIIAGINGAGKSNLFDAIRLLARLAEVDLKTAFNGNLRGRSGELFSQFSETDVAEKMLFEADLLVNRKIRDQWGGEVELNHTRLRYTLVLQRKKNNLGFEDLHVLQETLKKISPTEDTWIKKFKPNPQLTRILRAGGSREPFIQTETRGTTIAIKLRQDGKQGGRATPADHIAQTVIGSINTVEFPHALAAKEEMRSWRFLQLNPDDLREPTPKEPGMSDQLSPTGKNLAAALYRIQVQDPTAPVAIAQTLYEFVPQFKAVEVVDDEANRQLAIRLQGIDGRFFSSRVLSAGTLRILALSVLQQDDQYTGLLCLEEPENGIHPERIAAMVELLKALSADLQDPEAPLRQVVVNTHSPQLVGQVNRWREDPSVELHFARMQTQVDAERKKSFQFTRIVPVNKAAFQSSIFSETELKISAAQVKAYLETAEF